MNSTTTKTGARLIAETIKGYGITHVFYVDAILRKTMVDLEELGIHRVITHSEKAAAYMADGYARASHRPSVCMAQSVGAANLASGLQDPYLGLSPVIALTGKKPPLFQHRNAYQEIDHAPLFAPVTKFNADVNTIAQLPILLRQAFREATSGIPGPVHLDLLGRHARDLEIAEGNFPTIIEESFTHYPTHRPEPEHAAIVRAAQTIRAAKRPVIVAGGGVRISSARAQVIQLAEQTSIPVATSVNGKGTIVDTHPLSVGVVGSYSVPCANQVVAEADLVIYIGSNTGDQVTHDWTVPRPGTPIVQIDLDPAEVGRSYPGTIGIVADIQSAATQLASALQGYRVEQTWLERVQSLVKVWRDEIEPIRNSNVVPIRPERLCKELGAVLPDNAILVSDTGYAAIWTATMVYLSHPQQTFLRAAGSLGWGFPAALGVKCAMPNQPVICFTGDGGFWYHLSELETARRHHINTVTIVNNNHGLAQGIDDIRRMYGKRPGRPEELYQFELVSFAKIAQDMGCLGWRVEQPDEIADAIRAALVAKQPAVVEVVTDLEARVPEPWTPRE